MAGSCIFRDPVIRQAIRVELIEVTSSQVILTDDARIDDRIGPGTMTFNYDTEGWLKTSSAAAQFGDDEALTRDSQVLTRESLPTALSVMFKDRGRITLDAGQGRLTTDVVRLHRQDLSFARVHSTGHLIELEEAENITFLLPERGSLAIGIAGREYGVSSRTLSAFRPTHRVTMAMPDKLGVFRASALLVPISRMRRIAGQMDLATDEAFPSDGVTLSGPAGAYLLEILWQMTNDLIAFPDDMLPTRFAIEVGHLVDEQLSEMLGTAADRKASRRVLPALSRLRPALDILYAQSDEPVTIRHMSQSLGVGIRSLQLAFHEVYGKSPRQVLNSIRLHRARQSLLAAKGEGQVTTIAMDCGFSHLGRFSMAYAKAFGERPSETLSNRRR